ncbi:hypothetical protein BC332_17820 [Capsicum chinense]|nr:hypothetical protein BC332_17820 [Capsicum chinense]
MTKEMEVVKNLDVEGYMGRWYEIASFPSGLIQPKDGVNKRSTYSLNPDGTVHVINETWSGGKRHLIEGTTFKVDPNSDEAKL